jgi:hypothetical protein
VPSPTREAPAPWAGREDASAKEFSSAPEGDSDALRLPSGDHCGELLLHLGDEGLGSSDTEAHHELTERLLF